MPIKSQGEPPFVLLCVDCVVFRGGCGHERRLGCRKIIKKAFERNREDRSPSAFPLASEALVQHCRPHGGLEPQQSSTGGRVIELTTMDLCFFCCSDEADMGVAPFDRVAAHIGLSDDDLLDFESDCAEAPTLARVVNGSKLHRGKRKGRVSSEVYRLEQNARRPCEESQELQSRKGSHLSRHLEKPMSRGSSSRRHTEEATSSERTPVEKPIRRKSRGRSAEGVSEMVSLSQGQQARRSSNRQMQPKAEEPSQPPRRSQGSSMHLQSNLHEQPKTEKHDPTAFRRLSDMSPEEKAKEKQRLQALVKEFAREAVAGFDLMLLDVDRGRSVTATFSMDRHLLAITIDSHDEGGMMSVQFGVASLTGVFRAEEYYSASRAQPPSTVDLSKCLVLTTKEPGCPKVVIVLDGRRERDKAYTCLKILRYESHRSIKRESCTSADACVKVRVSPSYVNSDS
ncbi:hypothetical protein Esti_004462 [Eimeria stiedai]